MFAEMLHELKGLNLPPGKFALFGSAPLCVRGLRECGHDLDLIVTEDLWDEYSRKEEWERKTNEYGIEYLKLRSNEIELYKTWYPGEWNLPKIIREAETIDGLPFVRLETVREWKKTFGRDKDKRDIALIDEFLAKQENASQ